MKRINKMNDKLIKEIDRLLNNYAISGWKRQLIAALDNIKTALQNEHSSKVCEGEK